MSGKYPDEKALVARVRTRFPIEAIRTDDWLIERGWELVDECPHIWVEAFADRTTEAARDQDWGLVKSHTEFLATEYRDGTDAVRKMVDVSYAENLMWDLDADAKASAWQYVAKEVQALYEQTWNS
ncbi:MULTISPECIES: hypothetical protein [unclassified Duganella]|uniref:DUF7674 family protein n=1 Tax=unclassified Duganella TaxID=2636909 RepID=UPI000701AAE5|nr:MULTISPECIES: hypothetical protein [unclassified Duganella]KQV50985.1 hypothetical protein ASD07_08665 [Duganella sp. Root336D2]KRC00563.1 hypothetical protein ASE26_22865 [Duganella sp. Root198D2]